MLDFGFYNMDCMQGMKQFSDKYFDLAICDPPYGINSQDFSFGKGGGKYHNKEYMRFDDSEIPPHEYFDELKRVAKLYIVFGGNYFLSEFETSKCVLVWDKGRRGMDYADCEIAITNLDDSSRIFNYLWNGFRQEDMKNKEKRIHPTQKPVALYKWILTNYAKAGDKILDTHVGSASSLIACYDLGFDFVGFEIDGTYYNMAKARIDEEMAQMRFDL